MAWARVTVGTWNPVEDAPARDAMEKTTVNMITSLTLKLALKMIRDAVWYRPRKKLSENPSHEMNPAHE